jgi:hypothetical protein
MSDETKGMMKWPLIIAAMLVMLRLVLEQAGAPETVNNIFGVSWLYFIIPVYFAIRIIRSGDARPFKTLFKSLLGYITYTRLMIIPTYWLAYMLQWRAPRFGTQMGGVVGEGISPVEGYLWIPVRNAAVWIVGGTVIGMIIGGVTLLIRRRGAAAARTA